MCAINREESLATIEQYQNAIDDTSGIIFMSDPKDAFYKEIGGFGMPETIIIDPRGEEVLHKRGPMTRNELSEVISSILN